MAGPTILCPEKYTQIINLDRQEGSLQRGDLRGKKRWGDGCSGFCAEAADRAGRRCIGRGDRRWELAWVSGCVEGVAASSPKFKWRRRGLEFLYPLKWRRFDTVNFFFKIIIEISDSQVKLSVQPVRFRFNLFLGQLTGLD